MKREKSSPKRGYKQVLSNDRCLVQFIVTPRQGTHKAIYILDFSSNEHLQYSVTKLVMLLRRLPLLHGLAERKSKAHC